MTTATPDAAAIFRADTANHRLTVLHDDGLYRHLRFAAPDTGLCYFDLVTWPGRLAITGDLDTFVFARDDDMLAFFRSPSGRINPSYWGEKVVDGRERLKVYSEDNLRTRLKEDLDEYEQAYPGLLADYRAKSDQWNALPDDQRWPAKRDGMRMPRRPMVPSAAREALADAESGGETMYEDGARRLLSDLESGGVLADTRDWDLTDWDFHFLRALHAIVWGIGQYDAARVEAVPS